MNTYQMEVFLKKNTQELNKEKEDIMNTEVLKEKREYALDYSKNIQKMKFNILFLKNSQA